MQVLLVYGTTQGQTQKITRFIGDRLTRKGHQVATVEASHAAKSCDLRKFDAVLIAASVHLGHYQAPVIRFVREHRAVISARANAFLSVSLSAASHEPDDIAGSRKCVADFVRATGWTPHRIHHVAGAFRYTAYHFLTRCVMRYIAYRKGAPTDSRQDHELTDWDDLARFVDTFAATETVVQSQSREQQDALWPSMGTALRSP
jgi:menaquinone-dependent protoporphyrinogen oxidase